MPLPLVYFLDDDESIIKLVKYGLRSEQLNIKSFSHPTKLIEAIKIEYPDVVISDVMMPEIDGIQLIEKLRGLSRLMPVILVTGKAAVDTAVRAMKTGAFEYLLKPINFDELRLAIGRAVEVGRLRTEVAEIKSGLKLRYSYDSLIGESKSITDIREFIRRVSPVTGSVILLRGESGVGKNLVARVIHYMSPIAERRYLEINCASLPSNLLEAELFGYEKGAFTDAKTSKKGLLEVASGGTVLLDEITSMDLSLQAKFLSFIENRRIRRVGGLEEIPVDLRVISATNSDLEADVVAGKFRSDLFYRINVVSMDVPRLRDREKDVILIGRRFIEDFNVKFKKQVKGLTGAAERKLLSHDWPGNVRELRNVIERAMIFAEREHIDADEISLSSISTAPSLDDGLYLPKGLSFEQVEAKYLKKVLEWNNFNLEAAAKQLGVTRKTLWERRKKFGLLN
ncbi:MAG: sigma-54 dependent transcriptional regulator [Bacteroidetes bacterium]|nr:sigma-54 dependent transcriptional regulator [Bacteroidota bacterium]